MPETAQLLPLLPCEGCGQLADSRHIAMRLERLEWASRFRPIHIQTLLLSGIAPAQNDEFFYNPYGQFQGEARKLLQSFQIAADGKSAESVLGEVQKRGLMLIHVLECPLSAELSRSEARPLLENQLATTVKRIRRSLKPKRVLLVFADMVPLAEKLLRTDLGCPVFPSAGGAFLSGSSPSEAQFQSFRVALVACHAQTA
jgi:hypothetical protein